MMRSRKQLLYSRSVRVVSDDGEEGTDMKQIQGDGKTWAKDVDQENGKPFWKDHKRGLNSCQDHTIT